MVQEEFKDVIIQRDRPSVMSRLEYPICSFLNERLSTYLKK